MQYSKLSKSGNKRSEKKNKKKKEARIIFAINLINRMVCCWKNWL